MLTQLQIRNFAIVDTLDLDLRTGMTVVSGETGAGKSIMIDALGLALGDRADSDTVRHGCERAEITALFDLSGCDEARNWLQAHDLDEEGDCLIRRIITREGRSRSYINGKSAALAQLRELGELLVDIHGQHEHQRLLKKEHHRTLLDAYAQQSELANQTTQAFRLWQSRARQLQQLTEQSAEKSARIQLLSYQLEELDLLDLLDDELLQLEEEQRLLENAEDLLSQGHQLLELTSDGEGESCAQLLNHCLQLLGQMKSQSGALLQAGEMINNALIQVEEASREIRHYLDGVELNPERLQLVNDRLTSIYDIARKHRILPEHLPELHRQLRAEMDNLHHSDAELETLHDQVIDTHRTWQQLAQELSSVRQQAALRLSRAVDEQLHLLGMPAARFHACLTPFPEGQYSPHGLEEVEFLIQTNKGQSHKPLARIASGGELSRISLAIQVVTAQTSSTPTLIFDEVDVGIGGAIAEVVGRMLRHLGERCQILCVTHQPQVASQGHQHLFVSKRDLGETTSTQIRRLSQEERVEEVARMLGGIEMTDTTRNHAREMLCG